MKRFMVMCTCLSLVMIVVGGIPQASAELRGYEVVRSFGPIIKGGAKSAKIVYCSKGRVVLGGGVHRTWTGGLSSFYKSYNQHVPFGRPCCS
jgi:hypothetical protein